MRKIIQLEAFRKEIAEFSAETREDIFSLIARYLTGERLDRTQFKTFKIDKNTKIQEFKVRDAHGNWRAISPVCQELQEKEKETIRRRIGRIDL